MTNELKKTNLIEEIKNRLNEIEKVELDLDGKKVIAEITAIAEFEFWFKAGTGLEFRLDYFKIVEYLINNKGLDTIKVRSSKKI